MNTLEIKAELGSRDCRNNTSLMEDAEYVVMRWRGDLLMEGKITLTTYNKMIDELYRRLYDERWTGNGAMLVDIAREIYHRNVRAI